MVLASGHPHARDRHRAAIDKDMLGSISGTIPPKNGITVFNDTKTTIIPAIKGCEPKRQ